MRMSTYIYINFNKYHKFPTTTQSHFLEQTWRKCKTRYRGLIENSIVKQQDHSRQSREHSVINEKNRHTHSQQNKRLRAQIHFWIWPDFSSKENPHDSRGRYQIFYIFIFIASWLSGSTCFNTQKYTFFYRHLKVRRWKKRDLKSFGRFCWHKSGLI